MKRLLVTGKNFAGAVVLLYGEEGLGMGAEYFAPLLGVDFKDCSMSDLQKAKFMHYLPTRLGPWKDANGNEVGFEQSWGLASGLRFTEENKELDFEEDFWVPYNNKKNKERSLKVWKSMTVVERAQAVARLPAYLRYISLKAYHKAGPERYLGEKYYNNDYDNL